MPNPDGEREAALKAMRDRGIDVPEHFLQYAEPARILGACHWYDKKSNGTPGLLAWKIKEHGGADLPSSKSNEPAPIHQIIYDDTALPLFFMQHAEWDTRRGYFPSCREGRLMLTEAKWPVSTVECDTCGWLAGIPHRDIPARLKQPLGLEQAAA